MYDRLTDLPRAVRNHFPVRAQEIYRAAYNYVWEWYGHDEGRAHRVAWAAVKAEFVLDEARGEWISRGEVASYPALELAS
jgi:cation transport regulator